VLIAVVTSLAAGTWFRYVLSRGWELLRVRGEDDAGVRAKTESLTITAPVPEKERVK
jgi:hypothetical protein